MSLNKKWIETLYNIPAYQIDHFTLDESVLKVVCKTAGGQALDDALTIIKDASHVALITLDGWSDLAAGTGEYTIILIFVWTHGVH